MSLQQINSAIPANKNFSPSLSNILENIFPKVLTKATDGQYSLVELKQAKLASSCITLH